MSASSLHKSSSSRLNGINSNGTAHPSIKDEELFKQRCEEAFKLMDISKSGAINLEELGPTIRYLGFSISQQELQEQVIPDFQSIIQMAPDNQQQQQQQQISRTNGTKSSSLKVPFDLFESRMMSAFQQGLYQPDSEDKLFRAFKTLERFQKEQQRRFEEEEEEEDQQQTENGDEKVGDDEEAEDQPFGGDVSRRLNSKRNAKSNEPEYEELDGYIEEDILKEMIEEYGGEYALNKDEIQEFLKIAITHATAHDATRVYYDEYVENLLSEQQSLK